MEARTPAASNRGDRSLGYPQERADIMTKNRGILSVMKADTLKYMVTVLKSIDQDLLRLRWPETGSQNISSRTLKTR